MLSARTHGRASCNSTRASWTRGRDRGGRERKREIEIEREREEGGKERKIVSRIVISRAEADLREKQELLDLDLRILKAHPRV